MLDALGLSVSEQHLYATLIEHSPALLADLRDDSGMDGDQLAETLELLENKGMVTRHPGQPASYSAVPPDIALEVLIVEQEEQLKRARLAAQQLTTRFREAANRRDPAELLEVVSGPEAVWKRIQQIQRAARREVRSIDRPPYLIPVSVMVPVENRQLGSGVRYRVVYDPESFASEAHQLRSDVEECVTLGEQARVLSGVPVKLILVDDRFGCLPLQADPQEIASMVVVHPSGLLEALDALFEAVWAQAMPLSLDGASAPGLTDDMQRLLGLLTAGVSDGTAARQLGVSPRTFQRRLQELMASLGARTRFQAGLQAGLRGWIHRE
ncbi:helix-turn-helix domain-containing protein [Stackebrandtia nassauensis]|uniref:Transcriptional regulator, TrmB n=1 Tax=Stackebrandtia nassauensis (strain DSM 44728 / CIP 108903 / NRRL B-16338 / NBRC 102104 / LLR-40K-21) TaxID=446470 RepID=D3PVQ2_STANL|nr:helix-turn-helix domain-containing protein [Stackebrandtia nassauensis]ADD43166.1 transcriptional regulator, TrmB [Stackebrandtia nassauensis DSM 44728]